MLKQKNQSSTNAHRKAKRSLHLKGFTIVELTVVIVVLGILAGIVTITFAGVQGRARDAKRSSSVASIVEKLESYYYANTKYPSCPELASFTSPAFKGLPQTTLVAPSNRDLSQPSLKCQDVTAATTDDIYGYVGDGTATCQTGSFCSSWTLKYKEESTGKIISMTSRHKSTVPVPGAPSSLLMVASANGTAGAMGTSGVASCTVGSPQYALSSRTNEETWTAYTDWSPARIVTIASTNEGGRYSFRAQARCVQSEFISDAVASNEADYIRPISAPAAPVLAKLPSATSGTSDTVTYSWGAVTCATGTTVEYVRAWGRDDPTGYRPYIASTLQSYSLATNYQGYQYKIKAQARCVSPYTASEWSAESAELAYLRTISSPRAATNFGRESVNYVDGLGRVYTNRFTFTPPTCGLGTVLEGRFRNWRWDADDAGGYPIVIKGATSVFQHVERWKKPALITTAELDVTPRVYVGTDTGVTTTSYMGDYSSTDITKSVAFYFNSPANERALVQYRCINSDTARFGEGSIIDSGIKSY